MEKAQRMYEAWSRASVAASDLPTFDQQHGRDEWFTAAGKPSTEEAIEHLTAKGVKFRDDSQRKAVAAAYADPA